MKSDRRLAWPAFLGTEPASGTSPEEIAAEELRLGRKCLDIKEPVILRRRGEGEGFEIFREGEAYAVAGGGKGQGSCSCHATNITADRCPSTPSTIRDCDQS